MTRLRLPSRAGAICSLIIVLTAGGCVSGSQKDGFPELEVRVARWLESPEELAYVDIEPQPSADLLIRARDTILGSLFGEPSIDPALERRLDLALDALDEALAGPHSLGEYARETQFLRASPRSRTCEAIGLQRRILTVFADPSVSPASRQPKLDAWTARLRELGFTRGMLDGVRMTARLWHMAENRDRARAAIRDHAEIAAREGLLVAETYARGQILLYKTGEGWSAADRDTLQWLVRRNKEARHAGGTSYTLSLAAVDAWNQNRISTTRLLAEDAIESCREFGDPSQAMSSYELLQDVYATLECWNQVEPLLDRLRQVQEERAEVSVSDDRNKLSRVHVAGLSARSLASKGELEAAFAAFAAAHAETENLAFAEIAPLGQQWVASMVEGERPELAARAIEAVTKAVARSEAPPPLPRLDLWRAWVHSKRGNVEAARSSLAEFESVGLAKFPDRTEDLEFWYAAIRAEVEMKTAPELADEILLEAWRELRDRSREGEPAPETYLDLNRNSVVRRVAHRLVEGDPELGYGVELLWRETYPFSKHPEKVGPTLVQAAKHRAVRAREQLRSLDAMHCVFRVERDRVVRWTADAGGVRSDTLDLSPRMLRDRVARVQSSLERDPGDGNAPVPPSLAGELAALARTLLPTELVDGTRRPSTLFVSGESFLAQVPFGPLNLKNDGEFSPLIETVDLAWLRRGPGGKPALGLGFEAGPALVVSNPELDGSTRRRFQLPASLAGAASELDSVLGVRPGAHVLAGERANRSALLSVWDAYELLYFIGHAVRDAEVPFTTWLPLAAESAGNPFPGVGFEDILPAKLERCRLVVLSGCATGAPFVDGVATAPSLGDAFLDAGADAVLQTFWRLRDQGTNFAAHRILSSVQKDDVDLVHAFSEECRRAMRGPNGIRHPFGWGAWSLKINS